MPFSILSLYCGFVHLIQNLGGHFVCLGIFGNETDSVKLMCPIQSRLLCSGETLTKVAIPVVLVFSMG